MTTELQIGIVRVLATTTQFGEPFQVPEGSPLVVRHGDVEVQVHVGQPPDWLCAAIGRRRAIASNILRTFFNAEPMNVEECWKAPPDPIVDRTKFETSVTLLVRSSVATELSPAPDSLWWRRIPKESLRPWIALTKCRFDPILDLVERIVPEFLPNAVCDRVLKSRVVFALDASFNDAFSYPDESSGSADGRVASPLSRAVDALENPAFSATLRNCLRVIPTPTDPERQARLEEAARTGRLRDQAGFLGKAELLPDLQVEQIRHGDVPLSVAFIDMNGLKQINDQQGHDAGDHAIAQFQSVVARYGQGGLIYRDGGDEFVLFLRLARSDAIEHVRKLLVDVLATTGLTASVGLAFANDQIEPPARLRGRADTAMYKAKVASKDLSALQEGERPCAFCVEDALPELVRATSGAPLP